MWEARPRGEGFDPDSRSDLIMIFILGKPAGALYNRHYRTKSMVKLDLWGYDAPTVNKKG